MKMKSVSWFIVFVITHNKNVICSGANLPIGLVSQLLRDVPSPGEIESPIQMFDPYEFDWAEFNFPGEIFRVNVNVSKGNLSGLSEIHILNLNVSDAQPSIEFNIQFPRLKFHTEHYELDGNIYYAVPLKGKGVAHIEIFNLQIWGKLFVKNSLTNDGIILDKLENAALTVERIMSKIDFDHNIDDIVSAFIEDLLPDYINRFNKFIIATYSDVVIQHINELLDELESL